MDTADVEAALTELDANPAANRRQLREGPGGVPQHPARRPSFLGAAAAGKAHARKISGMAKGGHRPGSASFTKQLSSRLFGVDEEVTTFQMLDHPPVTPSVPGVNPDNFMSVGRINMYRKAAGLRPVEDSPKHLISGAKPNPQAKTLYPGQKMVWFCVVCNVVFSVIYLAWRIYGGTISNLKGNTRLQFEAVDFFDSQSTMGINTTSLVQAYAWLFYFSEVCLVFAIWIGHTQRLFSVQRAVVTMDDLVHADDAVGYNCRPTILLPTAGERMDIVLKALLGCLSQRPWHSGVSLRDTQRVIILDEKRRKGILTMAATVQHLGSLLTDAELAKILCFEGATAPSPLGMYDWYHKTGHARRHLFNNVALNQACALVEYMDELAKHAEGKGGAFDLQATHATLKANVAKLYTAEAVAVLDKVSMEGIEITPGFMHTFDSDTDLPLLIYYSRKKPGMPKVSPKAGNMNAAIFPVDYFDKPPLIGDSTIVVVNDCRHQPQPEFLQRVCPYFFDLNKTSGTYCWAKVAFVQTPQRFDLQEELDDPLGNHAVIQYDIINQGKDGIGAVSSSGHGSAWRVAALQGLGAQGKQYADPTDFTLVGHQLGFRSEILIEDTHTSLEMFRAGWRSVYVNEPGEHLSVCTHQPDSVQWRVKQVLRWHQGAVQLLLLKGISYTTLSCRAQFPTIFHRIYGFDQATYYLQAFPGYMLILMPIVYGVTGVPPFAAKVCDFFIVFTPFIVTAILPTAIMANRRGVDTQRVSRDEHVWLATTFVQIHAFLTMFWQIVTGKDSGDAWTVKAPVWPLVTAFLGQFLGVGLGLFWLIYFSRKSAGNDSDSFSLDVWGVNFVAILVSASMAVSSLWPMFSMLTHLKAPSPYHRKLIGYVAVFLATFIMALAIDSTNAADDASLLLPIRPESEYVIPATPSVAFGQT